MKTNYDVMKQYNNPNNGGRERVYRDGNDYYIHSDWGDGFIGEPRLVSKNEMEKCLSFTKAPASVVEAILGK